tara:strand:+ start:1042 stop:1203 length:162 start_codon:yes stop_codon:yes gene_type:complete
MCQSGTKTPMLFFFVLKLLIFVLKLLIFVFESGYDRLQTMIARHFARKEVAKK